MLVTEPSPYMTKPLPRAARVGMVGESPAMRNADPATSEAWQQIIDYKLLEWGRNPGEFEDVGLDPPSGEMIARAIDSARRMRQAGFPAPTSVYPDANGGIVFERRNQDVSEKFHFWDDGTVEYCRFHGTQLIKRWPVDGG